MSGHADSGRVFLLARVVESFRGRWLSLNEEFSDRDVALDFVRHIQPTHGPTVARCLASGRGRAQMMAVEGDWLCDDLPGSFGANVKIPQATWGISSQSRLWAAGLPLLDAWESCANGGWMAYLVAELNVDRGMIVAAVCACVREAIRLVPEPDAVALRAVEVAEAMARGEVGPREGYAAARRALDRSRSPGVSGAGRRTLTAASFAALVYSPDMPLSNAASGAIGDAAEALHRSGQEIDMADIVRSKVPTVAVLRAAARAAEKGGR